MGGGWKDELKRGRDSEVQSASYKNSCGDIKYSTESTVNNIVITTHGVRWVLDLTGWSFRKLYKYLTINYNSKTFQIF